MVPKDQLQSCALRTQEGLGQAALGAPGVGRSLAPGEEEMAAWKRSISGSPEDSMCEGR